MTSPGPHSPVAPSSMNTRIRPDTQYPRCETWQESVPAIGLTFSDQRHPGSNVPRPTTLPATLTTCACPLPSNGRTSSGESKLLTSTSAMGGFLRRRLRRDDPTPHARARANGLAPFAGPPAWAEHGPTVADPCLAP